MVEIRPLTGSISSQLAGSYILEYLDSVRERQHEKVPQRGFFICFPGYRPNSYCRADIWRLQHSHEATTTHSFILTGNYSTFKRFKNYRKNIFQFDGNVLALLCFLDLETTHKQIPVADEMCLCNKMQPHICIAVTAEIVMFQTGHTVEK